MNQPLATTASEPSALLSPPDVEQLIADWLRAYLSDLLGIAPDKLDETVSLQRYGLDSSAAVALAGDLGDWLDYDLEATITYDHPSIGALAAALSQDEKLRALLSDRQVSRRQKSAAAR